MLTTVSFIGRSNSGKTTLLEKIISELKSRGLRVGVIKHTHHDFDIDQPGKDSCRFFEAGSDIIAVSSPGKVAFIEDVDEERSLSQLQVFFEEKVDILLTEGYKTSDTPKIVVLGNEDKNAGSFTYNGKTLAVISPQFSLNGKPQYSSTEVLHIVNLLLNLIPFKTTSPKFEQILTESQTFHGHICVGPVVVPLESASHS